MVVKFPSLFLVSGGVTRSIFVSPVIRRSFKFFAVLDQETDYLSKCRKWLSCFGTENNLIILWMSVLQIEYWMTLVAERTEFSASNVSRVKGYVQGSGIRWYFKLKPFTRMSTRNKKKRKFGIKKQKIKKNKKLNLIHESQCYFSHSEHWLGLCRPPWRKQLTGGCVFPVDHNSTVAFFKLLDDIRLQPEFHLLQPLGCHACGRKWVINPTKIDNKTWNWTSQVK